MPTVTTAQREQLKTLFDKGLVSGDKWWEGSSKVETLQWAISSVMEDAPSDTPKCVHVCDNIWGMALNDCVWSSDQARSDALFPIAIAQIESAMPTRTWWLNYIAWELLTSVVPLVMTRHGGHSEAREMRHARNHPVKNLFEVRRILKGAKTFGGFRMAKCMGAALELADVLIKRQENTTYLRNIHEVASYMGMLLKEAHDSLGGHVDEILMKAVAITAQAYEHERLGTERQSVLLWGHLETK